MAIISEDFEISIDGNIRYVGNASQRDKATQMLRDAALGEKEKVRSAYTVSELHRYLQDHVDPE